MPADSGAAFLVVQHLDPSRDSLLPGILSSQTRMQVLEGADGLRILANHIYVIPPNTRMLVAQQRIRLQARDRTLGPPMPIDDLLDSLASDLGSHAMGVVLSGSGSDGALGLQAIQREGGFTFAQDPVSAKFDSMPRAAIGTGAVDYVLPPRDIAAQVQRIIARPQGLPDGHQTASHENDPADRGLQHVFWLLHKACEIDFSHYKRGTIARRLSRRMALRQAASLTDYIGILEADPAETLALGRDLLIRVTEFFRDPETFEALVQNVFPRILGERRANLPVRIWVPGCASGEEVYSIAICLAEYLGSRLADTPVQIFGTDISLDALEAARAGRYIENIARNVSPERLKQYFVPDGDHYRIDKSIRDLCTFARHNVAQDPPFSRMDLVSCRNLLIYLDPILQRHILPLFHYALRPEGILMLGPSETVGAFSEYFGVLESTRSKVYIRKPRPDRARGPSMGSMTAPRAQDSASVSAPTVQETASEAQLRAEADRKALRRYAPPGVVCDDDLNIVEFRGDTSAWLVNREGPPSNNLQRLARPEVFLAVTEAIKQVRQDGVPVRRSGLRLSATDGTTTDASLEVHPVQIAGIDARWFLVFFEAPQQAGMSPEGAGGPLRTWMLQALQQRIGRSAARSRDDKDEEIARLATELNATRERLRAALEEHESAREELKSSEEELLSSNEEFRSTNEELETAKEELQSINEELSTTNDELRFRVRELKELHADVARSRDFAEAIIETITEPILVLSGDLRVKRANTAFCRVFATTAESTIGTHLYALGNGQWDIPALRELLEDILPQRTVVHDYEIRHAFPHIGMHTMRLNARRLDWPAQALILLTIEDITQQQADFSRLQEADRQKNEFLAMLGHELRNPLAAIRNGLLLWQRGTTDAATVKATQAAMQRQLDHEISLVDDLLDVSRITRGIITLKTARVDFKEAVVHAVEALRPLADSHQQQLVLSLPAPPLVVFGDSLRLEQIANNLLLNAIKYTPDGGRIELGLLRQGEEAVMTLADNGIGMEQEVIARIFDLFVQAAPSPERRAAGLGVGLALVRKLVELHGGTVEAYSEGRNRGSRFVVRLPVMSDETLPARQPAIDARPAQAAPRRRILVVDDNDDAAQSTAALLRLDGHEVLVARDGLSAIKCLKRFRAEVLLLDIGLPDLDGYEVARRIRSMPDQSNLLVVALSGYGKPDHDRHKETAIDHYLVKPADLRQLSALIAEGRK
ncbi:CheR family methyltransferase [Cupriavidus sp. TMH.W2]|uniref:CheR family methyltransferase n=1 Tax=Cupriavidus sp. TMH.W2 TaxID=3434465 RepID=UPI003D7801F1